MVRTQVQLTEEQAKVLHEMSAARQVSIAELIRNSVDDFVLREAGTSRAGKVARAKSVVGQFASGCEDISRDHDRFLAEAFQSK